MTIISFRRIRADSDVEYINGDGHDDDDDDDDDDGGDYVVVICIMIT